MANEIDDLFSDNDSTSARAQRPPVTGERLAHVNGNLKGGVDVDLSACTVIVGENGAGKTSVLDAVRLLLSGQHVAGPHPADLLRLSPNGETLTVDGATTSGETCAFVVGPNPEGKPKQAYEPPSFLSGLEPEQRDAIFPLDGAAAALGVGTRKAREAVFKRWGTAITWDAPAGIDTDQRAAWERVIQAFKKEQQIGEFPTPEDYAKLPTMLRSKALADGKLIKARREALETDRAAVKALPSLPPDVEALRRKLAVAEAWERGEALRARKTDLESALAQLRAMVIPADPPRPAPVEVVDNSAEIQQLREALAPVDKKVQTAATIEAALALTLTPDRAAEPQATCAACGTKFERAVLLERHGKVTAQWNKIVNGAKNDRARLGQLEQRSGDVNAEALRRHAQACEALARQRKELAERIARQEGLIAEVERSLASVGAAGERGTSAAEIQAEINEALSGDLVRQRVTASADVVKAMVRELDDLKVLEKEAGRAMQEYLSGVRQRAEGMVNCYMPQGLVASLELEDVRGKEACEWSVIGRDGKAHNRHTMSGSEFAALLVALSLAQGKAPCRVLLIDDDVIGRFSPRRLRDFFSAIARAVAAGEVTQAIACWTRPAEVEALDGWTVVKVGN